MAKQTGKIALVRAFVAGTDDHFQAKVRALSGRMVSLHQIDNEPNIGSVVAKLNGPRAGFPGYVAVPNLRLDPVRRPSTSSTAGGLVSSTARL